MERFVRGRVACLRARRLDDLRLERLLQQLHGPLRWLPNGCGQRRTQRLRSGNATTSGVVSGSCARVSEAFVASGGRQSQ